MKKAASILITILLFCMPMASLAQGNKADSLVQILRQAAHDSVRIDACWELFNNYEESNRDSARYYIEEGLRLARKNGKKLAEARCLVSLAYLQLASGRYAESLENLLQSFAIVEKYGNEENNWLANWSGSPSNSKLLVLAYAHHTFANLMTPTLNTQQQIFHYREAMKLAKIVGNPQRMLVANLGLGRTYLDDNRIDSALVFEKEAARIAETSGIRRSLSAVQSYLGAIYFAKNEPDLALQNLYYGISIALETGNRAGLAQNYYRLTKYYLAQNNPDSSLYYALRFKEIMENIRAVALSTVDKGIALEYLSLAYKLNHQNDSASWYQGLALTTKDSLNKARLNSMAEFQNLNLTEQLRLRDIEKEQQLYQSRVRSYALLAGLIIFSLIAFILYRNNKQKQKANVALADKNRDLEIESALEKVRSRSLAMHKSEELQDVTNTVFEQMRALKIEAQTLTIFVTIEGSKDYNCWLQNDEQNYFNGIRFPYFKGNTVSEDHQMNSGDLETKTYTRDLKDDWFHFMFTQSEMRNIPETRKRYVLDSEYFTASVAEMKYTKIGMYRYSDKAFTNQEYKILKRFAQVFEQAYIRFLDLQKAEAQAREAQIEVAMEKVRSRTMAMHKSEELKEVIQVVYEQFIHLNMHVEHAGFIIDYKNRDDMHIWLADPNRVPSEVFIPYFDSPHWNSFLEAKASGKDFFTNLLSFEEKNKFYQGLFNFFPIPDDAKAFYFNCPGLAISTALLDNVGLYIENFSGKPYTDEENAVLMRFGKVFQQTYTRFLDLQKAEAQAREAQIEAALERIRSRSMAMHKSEELADLSLEVVKQIQILGVPTWFCAFNIYDDESGSSVEWGSNGQGTFARYRTPREGVFLRYYEAGQKGESLLINEIGKDECPAHYEYLCSLPGVGDQLLKMKAAGIPFPSYQIDHVAFFKYGYIIFITYEPVPETHEIFKRFAKVFEQSYTRFLDLQKAEAQAREAQIEAALERVRSRSLAMHHTNELQDVVNVAAQQLLKMNIDIDGGMFIAINDEVKDDLPFWAAAGAADYVQKVAVPFLNKPTFTGLRDAILRREPFYTEYYSKSDKDEFLEHLFRHHPWNQNSEERKRELLAREGGYARSLVVNRYTSIGITNHHGKIFSDADNIVLKRFGAVLEQSYTRFLDLQKAEAQAREAQIEAALERVRSRTMSMQKSEELGDVAAVLFKQMNQLVTNLWTCGFVLCEKDRNEDEWWLSMDGDFTRGFFLPNVGDYAHATLYEGWLKGDTLRTVQLEGEALQQHYDWLMEIPVSRRIFEEMDAAGLARPEWQKLHAAYFSKGYLVLITREPSGEEEIFKRFAAVFNLTYTRFNDLQLAEAHAAQAEQDLIAIKEAKQKAEQALTELQATQKQLIQAEKMASLGELTAGIAHEIQNPLNFVNNFSEVNRELLAEIREEIAKGNLDEVKAIIDDMCVNEEKISEHGKRADSIVKGMLQHSRSSSGEKESTDINALADEYLRLAYHGLKAKDRSFNASFKTDFDTRIGNVKIIPQEIGRVLLNLINNAFYAVNEKKKQIGDGYEPEVIVTTKLGINQKNEPIRQSANSLIVSVRDNGNGIPEKIRNKIFQPFFTTKPTGQGTGLGLSLSYDIVKAHGGELRVETREGEGTEFSILLPIQI